MKKNLNKLATLALTGMMVAGMSFGVMAEEVEDGQQQAVTYTNVAGTGTIVKELKTDGKTFAPNTSFNFTVAESGALTGLSFKQTVVSGDKKEQKDIPAADLIAGTEEQAKGITISNATFAASQKGSDSADENGKPAASGSYTSDATVDIKEGIFTKPGIYVFKVTEEKGGYEGVVYDVNASGKPNTHYMLVQVVNEKNGNGAYTGKLKVASVVLQKADGTGKESKIVNYYGDSSHDEVYDLTLEKIIEGLGANRSEKFKFTITVTQDSVGADRTENSKEKYAYYTSNGSKQEAYAGSVESGSVIGGQNGIELGLNDKVHIYGLSAGDTVKIEEVSGDYSATYTVTENGSNGNVGSTDLTADGYTVSAKADGAKTTVTNTKNEITVTGVAMNIAPYAAMVMGAGAFAGIFLGGKRRKAEDED